MTHRELAEQLATRNDRCGHVELNNICLLGRNHATPHKYEPITKVIPIS